MQIGRRSIARIKHRISPRRHGLAVRDRRAMTERHPAPRLPLPRALSNWAGLVFGGFFWGVRLGGRVDLLEFLLVFCYFFCHFFCHFFGFSDLFGGHVLYYCIAVLNCFFIPLGGGEGKPHIGKANILLNAFT